ncbi:polysaccharide deacteylase family 2 protein [Pseudooceanicola antarcticus]|uniref:polysaccharide deacteylase family 2 protein n=1 Tax=Pseudooceanicola antarcticus TaxID=1247613 RepID=UPI0015C8AC9C|nr:polysaccharide deacteylase family 2 protein [Pseudooceanicola antarcticus]
MARGAITGFVWGSLLTGMALATASLTAPPPGGVPVMGDMAQPPATEATTPPEAEVSPEPEEEADQQPEAEPEAAPEAEAEPEIDPAPDAEPAAEPETVAEPAPESADEPEAALSEEVPAEPAPAPAEPAEAAEPAREPEAEVTLQGLSPVTPPAESAGGTTMAASDPVESAPTGFPASELDALGTAPEIAPEVSVETAPENAEGAETELAAMSVPEAETPAPEAEADLSPEPEDLAQPEISPRLPQVGETAATEAEAPRLPGKAADGPLTLREDAPDATSVRPFEAYAVDYDATDPRPRMAVVLIDAGDSPVTFNALRRFPYPLSFALDPSLPDATRTMRAYRDAGFEVLALSDLPEGAAPADVETATQSWIGAMPEAVALMEATPGALQRGRESSEQLAAALAEIGQGLVLYPEGLDTARKLAEREGVPAATLFRDFDAKGEDQKVIRRFLDYAALKADQEGGVVMVGRLRPETVSALLVWGLADRAGKVQLVPVTAVLADRGE